MFSSSNTFDPNSDIPDLTGKTYLVTGGSAGIGFGVCAHLIQHHAKVLLLSNSEDHAQEAIEELKKYGDEKQIEWIQCDLNDLKQTDSVAKKISERGVILAALIMNAGIGVGPYSLSHDQIESHFQVNWLSQLHLSLTLLPLLAKPGGRLIFQSSDMHRLPENDSQFADLEEINTDIGPTKLYNRSKLAQVLGMRYIQRILQNGGDDEIRSSARDKIYVLATHPGAVSTDQPEQAVEAYGTLGKIGVAAVRPFMKDAVDSGCRSMLYAATSPEIEEKGITGEYIVPDKKVTEPSGKARDEELGEKLWKLSRELLNQKLGDVRA